MKKGRKKTVRTIKEIIRLHFDHGFSQRAIARSCGISPTTAGEYLELARRAGLDWAKVSVMDDAALKQLLLPEPVAPVARKPLPDFAYLQKELKRKGVTLQLLFEEYRAIHSDGYSRSQFFDLYRTGLEKLLVRGNSGRWELSSVDNILNPKGCGNEWEGQNHDFTRPSRRPSCLPPRQPDSLLPSYSEPL